MFLFDKIKEPVFLKEDFSADKQLEALKELYRKAGGELRQRIEQEIKIVEAGIYGEKQVMFELQNSHMPMVVLHDLYFEVDGFTAQIDYLIVTRYRIFVVECKNLIGNIEIDSSGAFTRTLNYGKMYRKEGIYSPITQNQRHMEVLKAIRMKTKSNWLMKAMLDKWFEENYRAIVVLANPKTYLNAKYARKEIKNQVIRGDQLIAYIDRANGEQNAIQRSEKDMMELAEFFLEESRENPTDYLKKYKEQFLTEEEDDGKEQEKVTGTVSKGEQEPTYSEKPILCPKCGAPMVKRIAAKGPNAGKEFWGCSAFPKCRGIVNISES